MLQSNEALTSFKMPRELQPYRTILYTDDDEKLMQILTDAMLSEEEISAKLGADAHRMVQNAYQRDVIAKAEREDGTIAYILNSVDIRLNHIAVFEREIWEGLGEEAIAFLSSWHYNNFLEFKKSQTIEQMRQNKNTILPLTDAINYLKENGESFTVIPCDCHSKSADMGYTKEVCIMFGNGLNSPADKGLGRVILLDEAITILKQADDIGLIHTGEAHNICNCNKAYCYPTRGAIDMGTELKWPQTKYVVELDNKKCIGCGLCIKRCQFGVFSLENKQVQYDASKCWGCGLCESKCPKNALRMREINK